MTEDRIFMYIGKINDRINLFGEVKINQNFYKLGPQSIYFGVNLVCWWKEANERWDATNLASKKNKISSGEISNGFQVG